MEKDEKMRKQKLSLRSVPTQREIENSKKIAIKLKKLKIYHYGFISNQNRLENAKKEKKIKIIGLFRSYTTRNRKFQ